MRHSNGNHGCGRTRTKEESRCFWLWKSDAGMLNEVIHTILFHIRHMMPFYDNMRLEADKDGWVDVERIYCRDWEAVD